MDDDLQRKDMSSKENSVAKKPVPLPRKSLHNKSTSMASNNVEEDALYANSGENTPVEKEKRVKQFKLRQGSRSFQEKIRIRSEVKKIEKSLKKMIPKRRSIVPKGDSKAEAEATTGNCSLHDNDIFHRISFDSPLSDLALARLQRVNLEGSESDDASSDTESFCTNSELPPPYPPPPLPDESTYDELTSVSSDGPNSYYSPGSDSNSIYEELSNYLSLSLKNSGTVAKPIETVRSESWDFCNSAAAPDPPSHRYEEIEGCSASEPTIHCNLSCGEPSNRDSRGNSPQLDQTSSLVLQFDPLFERKSESWAGFCSQTASAAASSVVSLNPFEDPVILSFLTQEDDGDLFGNLKTKHDSIQSDCEKFNFELPMSCGPPPVPPCRLDSVTVTADAPEDTQQELVKSAKDAEKRSSIMRWSSIKRVARLVADNIENSTLGRKLEKKNLLGKSSSKENVASDVMEEGEVSVYSNDGHDIYVPLVLHHSGVLYRPGGVQRWGVLAQRKVTLFVSKDSPDVKETIDVNLVLSLRHVADNKISVDGDNVSCFEVSLAGKSQAVLLGAPSPPERHVWMRMLLESVTSAFPPKLALDYTKAGWCYFKEGISSSWIKSSVLLSQRNLHLVPKNGQLLTADLRKARCIALQEGGGGGQCMKASEKGCVLLVDVQDRTLYLQMDTVAETSAWEAAVRAAALQNGPALAQQQLTKDDVPTIVDKAINFVHTHGSTSEGIYRRSGSSSAIGKLLSAFRRDAWAVQLSRADYSEFDVSSVLKRFFRDLPEPLISPELHPQLRSVIESAEFTEEEKRKQCKDVLQKLPRLNYLTARRLMGHLYFIDKLRAKNLMPVENLAAIWGPTLMHVQEGASLDLNWSRVESAVISELISNYPVLFAVSEEELQRELKILTLLETFHNNSNAPQVTKKPSGDLKVWVYLSSQKDGECVSVAVPPGKLAREMCDDLSARMSVPGYALCLQEVVSGGLLRRPLHHSECVLDAILRWGQWPEEDRRDNCLVLTQATFLQELVPLASTALLPAVEELKFADDRTKNFKTYIFELSQTTLCYYKDKTCSVKVKEWNLRDIVWYLGHEAKRNLFTGWSMTFVTCDTQPSRTKDRPYFGNTLYGNTEQQKRKWLAAMLIAGHPGGILPPPVLID